MYVIVKSIFCLIITFIMQATAVGAVQVAPEKAADTFMEGLRTGQDNVVLKYVDNDYINMLENSGSDKLSAELYQYLFQNLNYEVEDTARTSTVAVARIKITNSDFSKALDNYDKASYKYVSGHLYDSAIDNKKKLNQKCLDIYVDQLKKLSNKENTVSTTIYLPMKSDGHYGWEIMVDNKLMEDILGGLEIPESK